MRVVGPENVGEPLVLERVLHPRLPEVVENHRRHVGSAGLFLSDQLEFRPLLVGRDDPVGRQALDRERRDHPDAVLVLMGLIVEGFALGMPTHGSIDLLAHHPFVAVGTMGDRLERDIAGPAPDDRVRYS
jgi:hypothetical protein